MIASYKPMMTGPKDALVKEGSMSEPGVMASDVMASLSTPFDNDDNTFYIKC